MVGVLLVLAIIGSVMKKDETKATTTEATSSSDKPESSAPPAAETPKPKENWSYSESEDKMSNDKTYFASTKSTNTVEFDFPYNGGSSFNLILRSKEGQTDVLVKVSKGQFMTSFSNDKTVRVKFDDGSPENFNYGSSTTGESELIFILSEKKFIEKLKKAQKVMIEAEFYQEGRQIMEFDVSGLNWDK